jgi:hypothetical protein
MLRWGGRGFNGNRARQQVERARCRAHSGGGDSQIAGRSRQAAVSKQQLNRSDVGSGFQQVNGEGVTQGVIMVLTISFPLRFAIAITRATEQRSNLFAI